MSTEELTKGKKIDTRKMSQIAILVAILIVLDITGIGFIKIPPISITVMQIPVIIGAIILGPKSGAFLGGVFGVLSMWESTTKGVSPGDLAFSPFYSGSAISSIIMALGCRILLGFVAGVLYQWLSKHDKKRIWSVVVTTVVSCLVHTATILGCLWILFPNLKVTFKAILGIIFSFNFSIEVIVSIIFAVAFAKIIPMLRRTANK